MPAVPIYAFDPFDIPGERLVGMTIQIRLPKAAVRDGETGAVVGDSGTEWIDKVVLPLGECRPMEALLDGPAAPAPTGGLDDDGGDEAHCETICPECLDSWATDWEVRLVLPMAGSGE